MMQASRQPMLPLATPIADGQRCLADFITDRSFVGPVEAAISAELHASLDRALKTLTPRQEYILRARFGLDGGQEHTLQAIGNALQLSRERVRQLEAQAFNKLRGPSRDRQLRGFLDN